MDGRCGHDRAAVEWSVWVNTAGSMEGRPRDRDPAPRRMGYACLTAHGHKQEHEHRSLIRAGGSSSSSIVPCTGGEGALGAGLSHPEPSMRHSILAVLLYMCSPWDFTVHIPHGTRAHTWISGSNQSIDLSLAVSAPVLDGERRVL